MAEQDHRRTRIWWLSGILAILGACIAIFAAMELITLTLLSVAAAVLVTILLGRVLAQADQ